MREAGGPDASDEHSSTSEVVTKEEGEWSSLSLGGQPAEEVGEEQDGTKETTKDNTAQLPAIRLKQVRHYTFG